MLRVLTLSTLFPDQSRPNFGPFVELQTRGLATHPDVDLHVVAPIGIPPLGRFHPRYKALSRVPITETWQGLTVHRPRFLHIPGAGGRYDPGALVRAVTPLLRHLRKDFAFDVIDAEFFWPDGPAAIDLGHIFDVPVSIKARGADIHHWGRTAATASKVIAAGQAADGILAVSGALKADMVALGMPSKRIAVHYTGIDRSRFHVRDRAAAKAALGVSGPLLVSIGALIERKGHRIVIDAVREIAGATLVIIGQGAGRATVEAAAAPLSNRVRFLGSQPHEVIADWLAAADAMVLISASEGLANAWVEALASGTPLVISDVGGAREVIDRAEAGVLVAPDAASVADGIRHVLARNADRTVVAATVQNFSWAANTSSLYAHLKAVAARH